MSDKIQPDYFAYMIANGILSADEMWEKDNQSMGNYIAWNGLMWSEFMMETGSDCVSEKDRNDFADWLERKFP